IGERPGDLDFLLISDLQIANDRLGADAAADPCQQGGGVRACARPIDPSKLRWQATEKNVLGDTERRHEPELLVNHRHAVALRVSRIGEPDGAAADYGVAAIRVV